MKWWQWILSIIGVCVGLVIVAFAMVFIPVDD